MHKLEQAVYDVLNQAAEGKLQYNEALITEFGEKCKEALIDMLYPEEQEFRFRMSNIGRPVRHLWLEKKFGRSKPSASFMIKMMYGYLIENLFVTLIKFKHPDLKTGTECEVNYAGQDIKGTLDIEFEDEVYDFKTASPYAYDNKFISFEALTESDGFGYQGQAIAYGDSRKTRFGGWFAVNKATGDFRVVSTPTGFGYEVWAKEVRQNVEATITAVINDTPPPCDGVEDEIYYRKPTGHKKLNDVCRWCPAPEKCHPTLSIEPSRCSKSANPKLERYID